MRNPLEVADAAPLRQIPQKSFVQPKLRRCEDWRVKQRRLNRRRASFAIENLEDRVVPTVYATSVALAESISAAGFGVGVTFTATVSSSNGVPTGTVTFEDGANVLGSVSLSSGAASISTSALAVGSHTIVAYYGGSSGSFYPSASGGPSQSNIISTAAGNGTSGITGNGGQATSAELNTPDAVAFDASGNMFIADAGNNEVRKVTPAGVISVFAGTGTAGYTGDGGAATSAKLNTPASLAFDSLGDLFIADSGNKVIRKVTPAGIISTFAGNGTNGYSGDGGQATSAELNTPSGVAFDSSGDLFIADTGNKVIREVNTSGVISTFAGNGTIGYSGDGGLATAAELNGPQSVAFDASGNLYIADSGNEVIRKVTRSGIITTFAGNGTTGYSGNGGPATSAEFNQPWAIAFDAVGDMLIADKGNSVIREVTTTGVITTVAGTGTTNYTGNGSAAGAATFNSPKGVVFNASGDLFIADTGNQVVRELTVPISTTQTYVVSQNYATTTSLAESSSTGGLGANVTFTATVGSTHGVPTGTVTFEDGSTILGTQTLSGGVATFSTTALALGSHTIVAYYSGATGAYFPSAAAGASQSNVINTVAGNGQPGNAGNSGQAVNANLYTPEGIAFDSSGDLFIADTTNNVVRKVTPGGVISIFAGNGTAGYTGNSGQATSAELSGPTGLAFDSSGDLFIADTGNNVIREVNTSGVISTVAGNHTAGYTGNGGPATSAELDAPTAVAFDSVGNLYIADTANNVIRRVIISGVISTLAGNHTSGYTGNGGQAATAELNGPRGVAFDSAGNVYIADTGNNVIRQVNLAGVISTVVGNHTAGNTGDGGQATSAELDQPTSVAFDAFGDMFIADTANNMIREVNASGFISTVAGAGAAGYSGDGTPVGGGELNSPRSLAFNSSGDLFLADAFNNAVREMIVPSPLVQTYTVTPVYQTTTLLVASASTGAYGANVMFTATVASTNGVPTGTVTFEDGATVLAVETLSGGIATFATSTLLVGAHQITAVYGGTTGLYDGSLSGSVTPSGTISTVAGNGQWGYTGDGGQATSAELNYADNVAVDAFGDLFIADTSNSVVREVTPNGVISTIAGNGTSGYTGDGGPATSAELSSPLGLAFDSSGDLFIADTLDHVIREVTPSGIISTFAGNGTQGFSGDGGQATSAEFNEPQGLAFNAAGDLFVADSGNQRIREITPAGVITTVAGNGTGGYSGDGGQATSAELFFPSDVALDASGDMFIADRMNNVIRKLTPAGVISTFAGNGTPGYTGDSGQAASAELNSPFTLVVDASGDLFIADYSNNVIREVNTSGVISTVVGNGTAGYAGDGGTASAAELDMPLGVTLDASGNLYIADEFNSVIRKVGTSPFVYTVTSNPTPPAPTPGGLATTSTSLQVAIGTQSTMLEVGVTTASGSPVSGGTVAFYDGSTLLGIAPVVNGSAMFEASALCAGTAHPDCPFLG